MRSDVEEFIKSRRIGKYKKAAGGTAARNGKAKRSDERSITILIRALRDTDHSLPKSREVCFSECGLWESRRCTFGRGICYR